MSYQIQGLSIHAEVHGTGEPALVFLHYWRGTNDIADSDRAPAHQARALRHDNASGTLSGLNAPRRIPCSSSRW
jgi:hypothetical protein